MERTLFAATAGMCAILLASVVHGGPPIIFENGPFFTDGLNGCDEKDVNVLNTAGGENTFGFNVDQDDAAGARMSDEFEICEEATVTGFVLQTYQTGAVAESITGATLRLWNGRPGDLATPGVPTFGDDVTNVLSGVSFTIELNSGSHDIYRATDTTPANCERHVQNVTITLDSSLVLPPGVYWLDWMFTGAVDSGPWQPPTPGVPGNAILFDGTWAPVVDAYQWGLPFLVLGTGGSCGSGCAADFDGDGDVDVDDLLFLLGSWGGPGGDTDGDGDTDVDDLLTLLGEWGPCEAGLLPASNDDQANALAISGYGVQAFDLARATVDGAGASCGTGPNLWYCWTAPATEQALIIAQGATVALYDACAPIGAEVACSEGSVTFAATQGQSYLIELIQAAPGVVGTSEMVVGAADPNFCQGAVELLLGQTPFDTTSATTDGPTHPECDASGDGGVTVNDIWYVFNASADGLLQLSTCEDTGGSADYDTDIVAYDGCDCGDLVLLGCNDDAPTACGGLAGGYHSNLIVPVEQGSCYLVRVGGWEGDEAGTGVLDVSIINPTENDDCANAIEIFEGQTVFSTLAATTDGPDHPECETAGDGGATVNDIWYLFNAPQAGDLTVSTCADTGGSANYDSDLVVYDGCDCANLTLLGCNDDAPFTCGADLQSSVVVSVEQGGCYLVRVGGYFGSAAGTGVLNITYDSITGPVICSEGIPIEIDEVVEGDTSGAPLDLSAIVCAGTIPAFGGYWYSVIGDGGTMTATTCEVGNNATLYNTMLSVYCGGCSDLVCVNANEDDILCFLGNFVGESSVQWCSEAGRTYTIFVHGQADAVNGSQGAFAMQVTSDGVPCTPDVQAPGCGIPENDECASALPIFDGLTLYSTSDAGTDGPANAACEFDGQTYNDIWYEYVATATGTLTISTCEDSGFGAGADYDTDLVVYDGCGVCADLSASFLGCNDDNCATGFHSELAVPVTQGNCYTIRLGGYNPADEGDGTVFLGVN